MKTVLVVVESMEPGNLHRGFCMGIMKNADRFDLNVIPFVFPRDVKFNQAAYNELILHTINKFKVDLFITLGGEQISKQVLSVLGSKGIKRVTWQIDDPFMLLNSYGKEMKEKLYLYDFIYSTNKESINNIYPKLKLNAKFFSFGFDPQCHIDLKHKKIYDATFVGSSFPERKNRYISKLGNRVHLWGSNDPLWNHKGRISHSSMVELVNQSRINVNFSDQPAYKINCLKNRVIEVLGCNQFLLTEDFPELEEMFITGKEVENFNSLEELNEKMDFYLKNEAKREKIAGAGADKVKKFYSYERLTGLMLQEVIKK